MLWPASPARQECRGGWLWLICRPCYIPVNQYAALQTYSPALGYSATYLRNFVQHDRCFGQGIAAVARRCCRCGSTLRYRPTIETFPSWPPGRMHYLHERCDRCEEGGKQFGVTWQLLSTAEGRQFWLDHPRLRFLPDREIEVGGAPALLASAESVTDSARLEGVFLRETFERLWVEAV